MKRATGVRVLGVLEAIGWIVATCALASLAVASLAGGVGFSRVLSASMAPAIKPGDVVVTKPVPAASLRVGDIPVLIDPKRGTAPIAHRVVSVNSSPTGAAVLTKGDANPAPDDGPLAVTSPTVPVVWAVLPLSALPGLDVRWLLPGVVVLMALALGVAGIRRSQ
jgi:signal peptidase